MSRKNRNNNRYNSRNRNQWDEGLDDYFDDDDQLESEEEESSEDQDEYEDEEYEDEEDYDEDEEEYEDDEEEYDDEEYEEDDEDIDEEEDDEEEEEYDEEEDEEDEEGEDDDELEDEINAATESTARKNAGNSDLLSKLRGQMRPQLNEESSESDSESSDGVDINVSPLSLFGQPIVQNGKKNNNPSTSTGSTPATPQHANARIVQSTTVSSRSESKPSAPIQKSGSGRVITAQSQNGASVSSVQPRDLEAEKAEAEKKQKEKERLENEQKEKEEKSARVLDKFKGKKTSAGETAVNKTKAGAAWLWSKIASGSAWIWAGIAAGCVWLFWKAPKHVWQNWNVFSYKWWSGIGSGVWNVMKKPFVKNAPATDEAGTPGAGDPAANGLASNAAQPAIGLESAAIVSANSSKRKSRKNATTTEKTADAGANADKEPGVVARKEPDSRRRLYWSLTSIGAAAVLFLLVLPSLMPGTQKTDENAVAVANDQNTDSETSNQNNGVQSNNSSTVSNQGTLKVVTQVSKPETPSMNNPNGGAPNMRNVSNPNGGANMGFSSPNMGDPGVAGLSGAATQYPTSQQNTTAPSAPKGRNKSPKRNVPQTFDNNSAIVPPAPVNTENVTSPSLENPNLDVSAPEIVDPEIPAADDSGSDFSISPIETPDLDVNVPDAGIPLETAPISEPSELNVSVPDLDVTPDPTTVDIPETPPDRVGSQVDVDSADPDLYGGVTLSTSPSGNAPEPVNIQDPTANLSEPSLSEPLNPEPDVNVPSDPFNVTAPDVPADSTGDSAADVNSSVPVVTEPDASVPTSPDLTSEPELSAPELPDPQPLDSNPIEMNPIETTPIETPTTPEPTTEPTTPEPTIPEPTTSEPTIPEPTIPEPAIPEPTIPEPTIPEPTISEPTIPEPTTPEPTIPEPTIPEPTIPESESNPIETGVAVQTPESSVPSESLLTPESNTQVVNSPAETPQSPLADSSVEVGMPGPLVSSNSGTQSAPQAGLDVNQGRYNDTPSTNPSYTANQFNNNYAADNVGGNYSAPLLENKGVYTVQPTDSFWSISQRIYGSGEYAPALARYNSSRIGSQSLAVSVEISTPPVETLEQQYPELCPVHKRSTSSVASVDAPPAGTRVYIVDQEETVMDIAQRELGNVIYCSQIYKLNQQLLSGSIDRVPPGVRILLPVLK
ncbi:MAG: hypothetical protein IJQ39_07355 [Thermoguttaceae bacterium]|nr:hypothetical protein [Thermoguttaceae bacterium]